MITIAVLLTVHNRREKTLKCLSALTNQDQGDLNFEIDTYLVDDCSTDGTSETIAKTFPKVNIITGNGSLFWNRGMHLAWKKASTKRHDYYLWLNDDTYLQTEAILTLLSCATEKNNSSIICASICSAKTGIWTYGGYILVKKKYVPIHPSGIIKSCDVFNGNCVLVPDQVFQIIGNLDPIFVHAIGDLDYGLRAKKHKIKSYISPTYLASCEKNSSLPSWCLPHYSLFKRIKNLYSPLGNSHPYYYFRFDLRHFGVATALRHLLTIHFRLILPRLWKQ